MNCFQRDLRFVDHLLRPDGAKQPTFRKPQHRVCGRDGNECTRVEECGEASQRLAFPCFSECFAIVHGIHVVQAIFLGLSGELFKPAAALVAFAIAVGEHVMQSQATMPCFAEPFEGELPLLEQSKQCASTHTENGCGLLRSQSTVDWLDAHGSASLHRINNLSQHLVNRQGEWELLTIRAEQNGWRFVTIQKLGQVHHLVEIDGRVDNKRLTGGGAHDASMN